MLAANNGRADLVGLLLDAGADASRADGDGLTALHSACVDLALTQERSDAGLACDPEAVLRLLIAHGARAGAESADGRTALSLCETAQAEHACAQACARLLRVRAASRDAEE